MGVRKRTPSEGWHKGVMGESLSRSSSLPWLSFWHHHPSYEQDLSA